MRANHRDIFNLAPFISFTTCLKSGPKVYFGNWWKSFASMCRIAPSAYKKDVEQIQCMSPFTFNIFTLVAPSVSRSRSTTSESISFECSHYDKSMDYFSYISEPSNSLPARKFNCETSGCRCNATGLQPNRAYLVSLEACMLKTPFLCSEKSSPVPMHTRPDRKLLKCKCLMALNQLKLTLLVNLFISFFID